MADVVYPLAKFKIVRPGTLGLTSPDSIVWSDDTIKVVPVDTSVYTFSPSHEFYSSVTAPARLLTPLSLTGKTTTVPAVLDADDITFTLVTPGLNIGALILFKWTGSDSTSPLVAFIDTAVRLPLLTDGSDVPIVWDSTGIIDF